MKNYLLFLLSSRVFAVGIQGAIEILPRNARDNRLSRKLELDCCDLSGLPETRSHQYDIVCANLMFDLLKSERARIVVRLKPAGFLVLAGLLRPQFGEIRSEYEQSGLKLVRSKVEKGWQSGLFRMC